MDDTAAHEKKSSAPALEGVQEEAGEVGRKQHRADTSTKVAGVIVVLYGLYGFFSGIKDWVDLSTFLAGFARPHTYGSLSNLLFQIVWEVALYGILGLIFVLIAKSLLDSTQSRFRRLDVKRAGSAVPLILLSLSGVIGALSGVHYSVTSSLAMGRTPGWNLLGLVFNIVGDVALLGGIMFVGTMVVWWVVVALWSRFATKSEQT